MDERDGAKEVVQDVDFMDEVVEDGTAGDGALAPCVRGGEVGGGFVGGPDAGEGDDAAERGVG